MISIDRNKLLRTFGSTGHLIKRPMVTKMCQEGVTQSMDQIVVLLIIRHKCESVVQQDLVDIMGKDKSVILRMVDCLEKDDLLRRVADPNDRRRNVLELTEKGISLTNRVFEIEDQVSKELLQGITKEDLEGFFNVIDRIRENAQK
ncbi:MAG: MarR family transcriptional regulator [Breznakibacter sp.]|nr:MarR family transcriptional regulator [Breznakibacter sp.]